MKTFPILLIGLLCLSASLHAQSLTNAAVTTATSTNAFGSFVVRFLKNAGFKPAGPISTFLFTANASGDSAKIGRAYSDAVYSPRWKMDDVIPALKECLNFPSLFVKYYAAKSLYIVGDNSGYETLLKMVESPNPIMHETTDLRIQAAKTLAQYRQKDATPAIVALYSNSHNGDLCQVLANLGQPLPQQSTLPFVYSRSAFVQYAESGDVEFIPQLLEVFRNPRGLGSEGDEQKLAAAYALASMTTNQEAVDYLVTFAKNGLNPPVGDTNPVNTLNLQSALKYLGSIQNPEAKLVLESALGSSDPPCREIAISNLLFNQGGSQKALDIVIHQLKQEIPTTQDLSWDFILRVAAQLRDNPQITSATNSFFPRNRDEFLPMWNLYTVERANWPIYNWIDGPVVVYNPKK
jgi:hypothetical protein